MKKSLLTHKLLNVFLVSILILALSGCAAANCTTCNTCPNTAGMAGYN